MRYRFSYSKLWCYSIPKKIVQNKIKLILKIKASTLRYYMQNWQEKISLLAINQWTMTKIAIFELFKPIYLDIDRIWSDRL